MIELLISEDALEDLNEAFLFYEIQSPGLGDYFTACLKSDIEGLKITAGVHRQVEDSYYRLLSRVFPYGIFYSLESNTATIWAVLDLRRDPDWIRNQLGL